VTDRGDESGGAASGTRESRAVATKKKRRRSALRTGLTALVGLLLVTAFVACTLGPLATMATTGAPADPVAYAADRDDCLARTGMSR
jgi:hypothetical protein